jgi:hypothetical protein
VQLDDPRPDFLIDWLTCEREPDCRGIRVGESRFCLVHLDREDQDAFIESLRPGGDLDLSGTMLGNDLFGRVISPFRDPKSSLARFGQLRFRRVWFQGPISFEFGAFADAADFEGAWFGGPVRADWGRISRVLSFAGAQFTAGAELAGMVAWKLDLTAARFVGTASISRIEGSVMCPRARFEDGLVLTGPGEVFADSTYLGAISSIEGARVLSLRGCDVGNLVLTDTDLHACEFAGALRLDQLRIDGRSEFATPPPGRWTRRRVLAEELYWRGWSPDRDFNVGAERLAAMYRSLRKSFEDSKNEAGAGDFYYGEMEMRRHSFETPRAERAILWVYWLLSGYGQRAARAIAALAVLIATVGTLLAVWGQPPAEAAQIAVGAVVLREPGAELTEAGQWTVMVARVLGPVLLALAILAVRARVKR